MRDDQCCAPRVAARVHRMGRPRVGSEMPEIPDVGAIAQQVRARIKQIEDQLRQHQKLTDELERLRDALGRLEGEARWRVRRSRKPTTSAGGATPAATAASAAPAGRAPRGQNKAKV